MFCPSCRAEYVDGVAHCPECDVDLVTQLEEQEPGTEYIELVTVGAFTNATELMIAKSMLDDAEIDYFAKNEGVVGLFAGGQIGFNPFTGPIEIQVRPEDADMARELLEQIVTTDEDNPIDLSTDEQ
jgi:hypothetical protein